MRQKSKLTRSMKFGFVRQELIKLYGVDATKQITALAEKHYTDCERLCLNASEGELQHLNGTILPTASLYKALLEIDPENALKSAHTVMMNLCKMGGAVVGKLMKLPGMKALFMRLLPRMAVNMFGESCGFQYENYEVSKRVLKMDVTACPYCRYAELFECPELMPVFCDSDHATYGNLPGIRFERSQTLGTGGNCCDFKFIRE